MKSLADRLVEHNYTVKLSSMDDFKPKDLKKSRGFICYFIYSW
ncbi:sulfite reductase flavoprotein subunit [Staphylococcus gallinarum]|uniref:Sulfite reductase flavoprotein subunit n=1 Tax=Staphylococcus gallinarum TaxID=1293 RepID=A0A380FD04_STAGA|nr:sulfite reductase flavoprotein subunit [Staphylococcus gallinarum]